MKLRIWKATAILAGAAALTLLLEPVTQACSRIVWGTERQGVFAGRSMDWDELIDPRLVVYPAGLDMDGGIDRPVKWSSRYGSVIVAGANYGEAALDGMNEKGVVGHVLYLHATEYEKRDGRPGVSYLAMLRYLLDNSATVAEAVKSLEKVQVVPVPVRGNLFGIHVAIEDPTGDSAVIEFIDGKMVVHHGPQYAVMTNDPPYDQAMKELANYRTFGGDKPLPGSIESIDRFIRAQYFLKHLPQPESPQQGVAFMFQVMHTVAVPFGAPYGGGPRQTYPTWWITAADLTDRIYYFNMTQNPNVIWIDLKALNFSPSQPVLVLDPKDPALAGNAAPALQPLSKKRPE